MKKLFLVLTVFAFCFSVAVIAEESSCPHTNTEEFYGGYLFESFNSSYHHIYCQVDVKCEDCNTWLYNLTRYEDGLVPHDSGKGHPCFSCGYDGSSGPTTEELQAAAQKRVTEDGENIPGKTAIIIHNGNLREAASKDSADLGAVISGDEYEIVSYQISADNTVWLEIKYLDGTAWVSASLAKISGDTALYDYAEFYVNRTCRIKVSSGRGRIAPGTKNPIVAYVRYNEKYTILDCQPAADDTLWFKIKVDRTECWISSSLAELY